MTTAYSYSENRRMNKVTFYDLQQDVYNSVVRLSYLVEIITKQIISERATFGRQSMSFRKGMSNGG